MTRTGVFIRCAVCLKTLFHCAAESLSTSPEISAATNTPVPAADNQLRVKSAVHSTEKTPDTTSVIRWNSFVADAYHCMIANEPPATSVAGHTSKTCFQVPPSIFTNVATSQNGTRIETNGNWRPAIAESVTWSRPLTAASVTIGVPIAPQATGAVFARRFNTADWN